jgi:hypothetical protein
VSAPPFSQPAPMPAPVDRLLRSLAALLAPYLEEELSRARPTVSPAWDDETCRLYVSRLSPDVARRALVLFTALRDQGRISSRELATSLAVGTPKALAGRLTTSLKRNAKRLELPLPFAGGEGSKPYGGIAHPRPGDDSQRTYWEDRDGIAARMVGALTRRLSETA